jgi:hypothetical protein
MKKPPLALMGVAFVLAINFSLRGQIPQLATAQGNLVFNGSFDTDASGWVVSPGSSGGYLSTLGNPAGCFLLYSSSSSNYPTISQTINGLVSGSSYLISGDYILSKGQAGITPSFGVAIDDTFLFEGLNPSGLNWSHFSFDYIATSPSAVLSLSAQINGTDVSYLNGSCSRTKQSLLDWSWWNNQRNVFQEPRKSLAAMRSRINL